MPLKNDETPHRFPQSLLESINENSGGGYFLCLINGYGDFSTYTKYDTVVNKRALLDYTKKTAESYQKLLDDEHNMDVLQSEYGEGLEIINEIMKRLDEESNPENDQEEIDDEEDEI